MASKDRNKWHWFVYVVVVMRAVWFFGTISGLVFYKQKFEDKTGIYWSDETTWLVTAWFTLSFLLPLTLYLIRRIPRYLPPLAEIAVSGGMYLYISTGSGQGFDFYNVPVLTLGFISIGWHAAWAFAVGVLLLPAFSAWTWGFSLLSVTDEIFNLIVLFGIGFCFQRIIASYQKINGMYGIIHEQNQTLQLYSKQIEKLTLEEERNRLSRDLHDTVGHTFTTTIMGMDAVRFLIDVNPEEAKKNLKELLQVTRNGLDEVRRHIHQIAPEKDGQSLSANLSQLGSEFAVHTGTKVEQEVIGEEYPVSEHVRSALIRCLQESLTNAKKHGLASSVRVMLTFGRNTLKLRITDNGQGAEGIVKGFGLEAMTDRMLNLNGTLEIESSPERGTTVVCTVPAARMTPLQLKREGA